MIEWQPVDHEGSGKAALVGADLPPPARVPLGRLLVEAGHLTPQQLDDALYEGTRTGERLGEVVVRRKLASEDDVARVLALQWGLDYVDRASIFFDPLALAQLSREDAQRLEALPTRVEDGHFVVAVAEPTEERLAALRRVIGEETVVVVVPKTALDAGLTSELLARRVDSDHKIPELAQPPPIDDGPLWGPPPLPPQPLPLSEEPAAEEPPPPAYEPPAAPEPPAPEPPAQEPELQFLAPISPLPVVRQTDADADAVVALANEARAAAERLAAQAAALSAQSHQTEAYEARIAALERQLAERTQQLAQVRDQLEAVLRALHS